MLAVIGIASAACAIPGLGSAQRLAGLWQGWMAIGKLGNGPASMTIRENGAFEGVVRLADGDRPFHGAISAVGFGHLRYDGTFGDGTATLDDAMLKLVPDGGGGAATFARVR
jgi:hypothetical protein